jgi:hypothetical protein
MIIEKTLFNYYFPQHNNNAKCIHPDNRVKFSNKRKLVPKYFFFNDSFLNNNNL